MKFTKTLFHSEYEKIPAADWETSWQGFSLFSFKFYVLSVRFSEV